MSKIAFIGSGRMASAMVDGLLAKAVYAPSDIACLGGNGQSAAALAARTGIRLGTNLEDLIASSEIVVVAFKPQHLASADPRLAELTKDRLVISVLAAKTLARLDRTFPKARNLIRCMPNTPAAIGAGVTGWCCRSPLSATDRDPVTSLLRAIGKEVEIPETQIDALMAVSGCGPAFVFEFTAALRDAGVSAGLDHSQASMLALETVLGAARLMARTQAEPEQLRNQVTSPNGTTYAGLQRLAAHDFRGIMQETVLAAKKRSEELSLDS
jgi:pyrroline-5-carboxylate reductase